MKENYKWRIVRIICLSTMIIIGATQASTYNKEFYHYPKMDAYESKQDDGFELISERDTYDGSEQENRAERSSYNNQSSNNNELGQEFKYKKQSRVASNKEVNNTSKKPVVDILNKSKNNKIRKKPVVDILNKSKNNKIPKTPFVKRKGELMIPANGECLFTSVLLGYLLPVLDHFQEFKNRCIRMLGPREGAEKAKRLLEDLKRARATKNYLEIVQEPFLGKIIIRAFKANMGIDLTLWGGANEIQILCDKLSITIEEYIPNPLNNGQDLVEPKVIKPRVGQSIDTIGIIQDVASYEEQACAEMSISYKIAVEKSIQEQVHAQHFRLKIDERMIQSRKKEAIPNQLSNSIDESAFYRSELEKIDFDMIKKKDPNGENINDYEDYHIIEDEKNPAGDRIAQKIRQSDSMPPCVEKYLQKLWCYLYHLSLQNKKENKKFITPENETNNESKVDENVYAESTVSDDLILDIKQDELINLCKKIRNCIDKHIQNSWLLGKASSYMKVIEKGINQQKWEAAFKESTLLLRKIQPVNIKDTLSYAAKAEEASNFIEDENIILFIGSTGVGKSTTLLYLMNCKMEKTMDKELIHIQADKSTVDKKYQKRIEAITSSAQARSETRYITGVDIDPKDFFVRDSDFKKVILCDTPGFEDSAGPEVDIANGTGVIEAIKKAKGVTIALLIAEKSLYFNRMQPVINLVYLVSKMMPKFNDNRESFTYLFTKVSSETKDQIHRKFKDLLNQEGKGSVASLDKVSKAILGDIEYDTKTKTWIVDPMRQLKKTPTSKDILEHLLKKAIYISNPADVFETYLSEKSLKSLEKQLGYHQDTILIAIKGKDFVLAQYKLDEIKAICKLLKCKNINSIYKDITKEVRILWDEIANKAIQSLQNHLLSEKSLEKNIVDEYIDMYNLYYYFDNTLRQAHFKKRGVSSELFLLEFKESLVKLRIKIMSEAFANPKKTKVYLQKLNDLSKVLGNLNPFIEKTNQLLAKELQKKEKEAFELISCHRFEELSRSLSHINQSSILQEVMDKNISNIQETYLKIKQSLINYIQKKVKKGCKILGEEYQSSNGKKTEGNLDAGETPEFSKKKSSTSHQYIDLALSDDDVALIEDYYSIIEKVLKALKENEETIPITKEIRVIYNDFLNKCIYFVQKCTDIIRCLLDSNISKRAPRDVRRAHTHKQSIIALRTIPVICHKTYDQYALIQSLLNSYLEDAGLDIENLVKKILKKGGNADPEDINKLSTYVRNIMSNPLNSREDQDEVLKPLEKIFKHKLSKIHRRVKYIDLSLDGTNNFNEVENILSLLTTLRESKISRIITIVSEYEKKIWLRIRNQVSHTLNDINESFDEKTSKVENKRKLAKQLESYQQAHEQLKSVEQEFKKDLQKLPGSIPNKEAIEKVIINLKGIIKKSKRKIEEFKKQEEKKKEKINGEIKKIEKLIRLRKNYDLEVKSDEETLNQLIKKKSNNKYSDIQDVLEERKKNMEAEKKVTQEFTNKIKKEEKEVKKHIRKKNKYEQIIHKYTRSKQEVKENIEESLEDLSRGLLPVDQVKKLRAGDVSLAKQEIKRLNEEIKHCESKKIEFLLSKLDPSKAVSALEYLKAASKVSWLYHEELDDDYKVEDSSDFNGNEEFNLRRNRENLEKYLQKYAQVIEQEVNTYFDIIANRQNNSQGSHKNQGNNNSKEDLIQDTIDNLYQRLKEIDQYQRYYQEELFKKFFKPNFIDQSSVRLSRIFDQLDYNYKRISRGDDFQKMIKESDMAKKMSLLDSWMVGVGERRFGIIYSDYQSKIYEKINDKSIIGDIDNQKYTLVHNEIEKLVERDKNMGGDDPQVTRAIENIRIALYVSISKLMSDIEALILGFEVDIENYGKGSQNDMMASSLKNNNLPSMIPYLQSTVNQNNMMSKSTKLYQLTKRLDTAQEYFFNDDKNCFLKKDKPKLDESIKNIKGAFNNWLKSIEEVMKDQGSSTANQRRGINVFLQVKKQSNILKNLETKLKKTNLFKDNLAIESVIKSLKSYRVNQFNSIQEKFTIPKKQVERNSLLGLSSTCERLTREGRMNELQSLLGRVEEEYSEHLRSIVNQPTVDIEEQQQQIEIAKEMLNSMPKELKQKVIALYNIANNKVKKRKEKQQEQIKQIGKNETPQEDIQTWNEYKNQKKSDEYRTIMIKIKYECDKIQVAFEKALVEHKLEEVYENLDKLKQYRDHLPPEEFQKVHKVYEQVELKKLKYGYTLLKDLQGKVKPYENLKQNPQEINKVVASLKPFVSYQKIFLKTDNQ